MTYPVGTRVWLRILQGTSRNGEQVLWRAVVKSQPDSHGCFNARLLDRSFAGNEVNYFAWPSEVSAALTPGRPGDLERTRRRLEKLNDEHEVKEAQ